MYIHLFKERLTALKTLSILFANIMLFSSCSSSNLVSNSNDENPLELGKEYLAESKFEDAKREFDIALSHARISKNLLNEAIALKYLGNLFAPQNLNLVDSASVLYEASITILENLEKEYKPAEVPSEILTEKANVLNNLALLHSYSLDFDKAIYQFQKVLKIDKQLSNIEGMCKTLINIGRSFRDRGEINLAKDAISSNEDFTESIIYFDSSLSIKSSGDALINKARSYDLLGNVDSAFSIYSAASNFYKENKIIQWEAIASANAAFALAKKSELLFVKNNFTETEEVTTIRNNAIQILETSLQQIENLRGNIKSDLVRASFFDDKIRYYEKLIELHFLSNNFEKVFDFVERAKSRSLLDIIGDKDFKRKGNISEELNVLIRLEETLSSRMKTLESNPDSLEKLLQLQIEYENILAQLKKIDPDYVSLKNISPFSLKEIQNKLKEDESILEYFLGKNFSAAIFINKNEIAVRKLDFQSFNLNDSIEVLRESFIHYNDELGKFRQQILSEEREKGNINWLPVFNEKWKNHVTSDGWQWSLLNLHALLVGKEFNDRLKNSKKLFIIPHGILHHFPFAALITSPRNLDFRKNQHLVRPKFFIEEKEIVMLPSASLLPIVKNYENRKRDNALIIGNPIYPTKNWANLKGAEAEASIVAANFESDKYLLLKKGEATETKVKSELSNYSIIHFAIHGEFDEDALKSKILFTKTETDDGYLRAEEIFELEMNANLVVLSACQSGQVGGLEKGVLPSGDDLIGLTRSFIFAGTPSIIATLWFVDDKATSVVMENFYKKFIQEGMDKAAALNRAQLAVLNDEENIDWKHPFYWAPFFLMGDYQ